MENLETRILEYAEFRPAWKSFGVYFLGALIFAIGPVINPDAAIPPGLSQLGFTLCMAFIIVKRFTCIYRLDANMLEAATSFPKTKVERAEIQNIKRIDLRRGITHRILGVAHVHVYVKDHEEPVVKLFGVASPDRFKKLLTDLGAQDERVYGAWRR